MKSVYSGQGVDVNGIFATFMPKSSHLAPNDRKSISPWPLEFRIAGIDGVFMN